MKHTLIFLLSCMLSACTWHPLTIQFKADSSLNQNDRGQSVPVAVKVVQLSHEIDGEDSQTLWHEHMTDHVEKIYLEPGSKKSIHWQRFSDTKYLAVIANFRLCDQGLCQLIIPLGKRIPLIGKTYKFILINYNVKREKQ